MPKALQIKVLIDRLVNIYLVFYNHDTIGIICNRDCNFQGILTNYCPLTDMTRTNGLEEVQNLCEGTMTVVT